MKTLQEVEFETAASVTRAALLRGVGAVEAQMQADFAVVQVRDAWTAQARMLSAIKRRAKSHISPGSTTAKKKVPAAKSTVSPEVHEHKRHASFSKREGQPGVGWAPIVTKKKKKKEKEKEEKEEKEDE